MEILRARAGGDNKAVKSAEKKLKFAQYEFEIGRDTNVDAAEAARLAAERVALEEKAAAASDTDTIDEYSTPNIALWEKIKSRTATAAELSGISGVFEDGTFLAEDAEIQNIHTLYKKVLKRAKCI